ncbi:MAG TPA: LuxR C-terminal-related transcriptional regulator [Candidatus Saccharimonadales bacterium]
MTRSRSAQETPIAAVLLDHPPEIVQTLMQGWERVIPRLSSPPVRYIFLAFPEWDGIFTLATAQAVYTTPARLAQCPPEALGCIVKWKAPLHLVVNKVDAGRLKPKEVSAMLGGQLQVTYLVVSNEELQHNTPLSLGNLHITPRERRIMEGVSKGLSNRAIGLKLDSSEEVIKRKISRLLRRLRVKNRAQLVMVALQLGLIE